MKRTLIAFPALAVVLSAPALVAQTCNLEGCVAPCAQACTGAFPIVHGSADVCANGGSFNLIGTQYEHTCLDNCPQPGTLPPLRFWAAGAYALANYGCADPTANSYLVNSLPDWGVGPEDGHWVLAGADWSWDGVDGCAPDLPGVPATAAEISDVDASREGTVDHGAWYLVAATSFDNGMYDFDAVDGATGCNRHDVKAASVGGLTLPARGAAACTGAPQVRTSVCTGNIYVGFFDVKVVLVDPDPAWFTDGGAQGPPKLIRGYQIVYAKGTWSGAEPTTSDYALGGWKPALDPLDPTLAAPVVPIGEATAVVTLPVGQLGDDFWLATRLVYEDPLNPAGSWDPATAGVVLASPVSRHCGPIHFEACLAGPSLLRDWLTKIDPAVPDRASVLPLEPAGDLYISGFAAGPDPDPVPVLSDSRRPLIFYAIDLGAVVRVTKSPAGQVIITF